MPADSLDPWNMSGLQEMLAPLDPQALVEYVSNIDSTNTELMRRARAGDTRTCLLLTDAQSAGRGGEIGWLTEAQIQPEIRQLVPTLALNAVSDPIKLEDGWHIVKLLDTKAANTPALDQIKDQLVQQMRAEKAKANSQAYLAKLLQENPLAINELELAKVLKKSGK